MGMEKELYMYSTVYYIHILNFYNKNTEIFTDEAVNLTSKSHDFNARTNHLQKRKKEWTYQRAPV